MASTMQTSRLLMIVALVAFVPTQLRVARADIANPFVSEPVGIPDSVHAVQIAGGPDATVVAFERENPVRVGVAVRQGGTWTVPANDVSGTGTPLQNPDVCMLGSSTFIVAAKAQTAAETRIYKTTDSGSTWALASTVLASNWNGAIDCKYGIVALVHVGADGHVYFLKSSDQGATWSPAVDVSDNEVNPQLSGTTNVASVLNADVGISSPQTVTAAIAANPTVGLTFVLTSTDGGLFWTNPYTANLGSTLAPKYTGTASTGPVGVATAGSFGTLAISKWQQSAEPRVRLNNIPLPSSNDEVDVLAQDADSDDIYSTGNLRSSPSANANGIQAVAYTNLGGITGQDLIISARRGATGAWSSSVLQHTPSDGVIATLVTDTHVLVAYRNGNQGGRLEVYRAAIADMFYTATLPPAPPPPPPAPPTHPTPTGWSNEVVTGIADVVEQFSTATRNNDVAVAFTEGVGTAAHKVGFALRDAATGTWTVKTTDITAGTQPANQGYLNPRITWVTGTTWVLTATRSFSGANPIERHAYRSTDDGATWTRTLTVANCGTAAPMYAETMMPIRLSANSVGVVYRLCTSAGSMNGGTGWVTSSNTGTTWTTEVAISDNRGSPAQVGTTNRDDAASAVWATPGAITPGLVVAMAHDAAGAVINGMTSNDGGLYWTVPWTTCPCPPGGSFVDGGTTQQAQWTSTTSAAHPVIVGNSATTLVEVYAQASSTHPRWSNSQVTGSPLDTGLAVGDCSTADFMGVHQAALASNTNNEYLLALGCSGTPNGIKVWYKDGAALTWSQAFYLANIAPNDLAMAMTKDWAYMFYTNSGIGGRLEAYRAATPTDRVASGIPAASKVQVSGLNGFDVDVTGRTVITRQVTGNAQYPTKIQIYDGTGLSPGASTNTYCNRGDGVAAGGLDVGATAVTYTDCTAANHNQVYSIWIKSNTLGKPPNSFGCPESVCSDYATQGSAVGVPPNLKQMARMEAAGWDFGTRACNLDQVGGICVVELCWVISTDFGQVGVYCVQRNSSASPQTENQEGGAHYDYDVVSDSPDIADICSWRNQDTSHDLVAAVSPHSPLTVFRAGNGGPVYSGSTPQPTFDLSWVNTPTYAAALGVGCGGNLTAAATATRYGAIHADNSNGFGPYPELWHETTPSGIYVLRRGVTASTNAAVYAVALSNGTVLVGNATSGARLGYADLPPGNFVGMRMDYRGGNLWVATDTWIYRYDLAAATGVTGGAGFDPGGGGTAQCPGTCPGGIGGAPGGTTPGSAPGGLLGSPGVDANFNLFAGFAIVGFCAYGGWGLTGGRFHRRSGQVDITPGNTTVTCMFAYGGLWIAWYMAPNIMWQVMAVGVTVLAIVYGIVRVVGNRQGVT